MNPQHLSTLMSLPMLPLRSTKQIARVTVGSASRLVPQVLCKSESNPLSHTSSTETELVACADVIPYEGVRKLLTELKFPIGSTVIHQDNQSTIRLIVRWIWGEKKNELEEGSEDGREGHTHTHTHLLHV
jgi:hypothetical protein